jgi:hypothetical protein
MQDALLSALAQGALLLTANRRLARHWRIVYDEQQKANGATAWPAPAIRAWPDWVTESIDSLVPDHLIPTPFAERRGWFKIIDAGPLLDQQATADGAAQAWALCQQYELPLAHPSFDQTDDTAKFRDWAHDFERRANKNNWLPAARREQWLAEQPDAAQAATSLHDLIDLGVIRPVDEAQAPRAQLPPMPFPLATLVLNVTNKCNLSCTYCYEYGEDRLTAGTGSKGAGKARMEDDTARQSIDFLLRNCGDRPVEVVHAMVASHTGVGSLDIAESTLVSAAGAGLRTVEVPTITLTDIVARLGGGEYSLVSDIEGAEVSLFTDHRAALAGCRMMIVECHATEWGGRRYTLEEVTQLPVAGGEWQIIDRYGAVAVYQRVK